MPDGIAHPLTCLCGLDQPGDVTAWLRERVGGVINACVRSSWNKTDVCLRETCAVIHTEVQ